MPDYCIPGYLNKYRDFFWKYAGESRIDVEDICLVSKKSYYEQIGNKGVGMLKIVSGEPQLHLKRGIIYFIL